MSEREKAALWNTDAPDGQRWKCPDCKSWATLGCNAAYHMKTSGHGAPALKPIPEPKGPRPCSHCGGNGWEP